MENTELIIPAPSDPLKKHKSHFSKIGLFYFCGAIIISGVQISVITLIQLIAPQLMVNPNISLIISSLSMYLIAMPLLVIIVRTIPGMVIHKKKMTAGQWIIAFFMCYALMYVTNVIGTFTTAIFGTLKGDLVDNPIQDILTGLSPLTAFFLMVICAPIVEEYVFRKLIIDRTVQYGQATAILLSGLMFALFHGNFNQFVYAFTLGVFWGFIYVKTGRLIYTVALHMTVNFLGSIPGLLLMKSFFNQLSLLAENNPSAIVGLVMQHPVQFLLICFYMLLLFGLVITGIIFWAINFKKFKCAPGEITIPKGKRFSTIILNVGMILYCLFWIIQIILQLFACSFTLTRESCIF